MDRFIVGNKQRIATDFRSVRAPESTVWVGNIDYAATGGLRPYHFVAQPKGADSVTDTDRANLDEIRKKGDCSYILDVNGSETTEDELQAGRVGVYRMRSVLGLEAS